MKDMGKHFPEPGILPGNDTSVRSHCCDLGIIGDPGQNRKALVLAEALQRHPGGLLLIDDHTAFFSQQGDELEDHLEIVEAKGCGLGHQDTEICVHDAFHDAAGASRRAVDDGEALCLF